MRADYETKIDVQASCVSIIDGAHSIGNLPDLDITRYTLHPDAYVTNLHKWLCTPKGTALLWVSPSLQEQVKPLVVSHSEGLGFAAEHLWTGTVDMTPWLSVPAAIEVHKKLGIAAEHKQRVRTLEEGVAALVKSFRCVHVIRPCVAVCYACTTRHVCNKEQGYEVRNQLSRGRAA
jgi:selenocysteine lyase/cysteine desulfurase